MKCGVELAIGRHRIGEQQPRAPEMAVRQEHRRRLLGARHRPVEREAALASIEAWELGGPVADNGDAQGVEALERGPDVEDRFNAGRDNHHRGSRERGEVRRFVEGALRVAVHSSESSGRHDGNSQATRHGDRSRHRRRAVTPEAQGEAQVARRELGCIVQGLGEAFELCEREAHHGATVEHANRRRHRAALSHGVFALARDGDVEWRRQAVYHDRGLERHDTTTFIEGGANLVAGDHEGGRRVAHAPRSVPFSGERFGRDSVGDAARAGPERNLEGLFTLFACHGRSGRLDE